MSQQSKNTLIAEYKSALDAAELVRDRARVEESVARQAMVRAKETGSRDQEFTAVMSHDRRYSALRDAESAYSRAKQKYDAACNLK